MDNSNRINNITMTTEQTFTTIVQRPEVAENWLTKLFTNTYTGEETRQFYKEVGYDSTAQAWDEWTPEAKADWEAAHSTETYAERVNRYIREQYDQARVEALTYNYLDAQDPDSELTDDQRTEYITAYHEYQAYRKECKRRAQEEEPNQAAV